MKKVLLTLTILSLFVLPLAAMAVALPVGGEMANQLTNFQVESGLGPKGLAQTIGSLINAALGLLGLVAVIIVIAGGFIWMTAAGDTEKVGKAKDLIFGGVIGMAIILASYAIAKFIVDALTRAVTP